MTAVPAAARPPHRLLPWFLLALSVVVNLFFIGGAVWFRVHRPMSQLGPGKRLERISAALHLDPQHDQLFERYFHEIGARRQLMRAEVQPLIADAWAEIANPQADPARIKALFEQVAEKHQQFRTQMITETLSFLATLTPAQRQEFVAQVHRQPPQWARPIPQPAAH